MHFTAGAIIVLVSVIFPVTVIITYTISLHNRHIIPVLPYISHTGNYPIDSCLFSLGINIVAGLYALIVFLRYAQILEILKQEPKKLVSKFNRSSLAWGLASSLALSSTANFQLRTNSYVHVLSAVVCSYSALVYFWHQTIFSFICIRWSGRAIRRVRLALSIFSTIIHIIAPGLYIYRLVSYPVATEWIAEWIYEKEDLALYVTGSFIEWCQFICNILYTISLYREFTRIEINAGQIVINSEILT